MKQKGIVVWLTGLPCSGKTTIANELQKILRKNNIASLVLDGDELRKGINSELGFSDSERAIAVKRTSQVAKVAADQGLVVIVAMVSPVAKQRESARQRIGEKRFVEVWVDSGLEIAMMRDVKGHYAKALAGKLPDFTGLSSPYERPWGCLELNTRFVSPEKSALELLWHLQKKELLKITWFKNKFLTRLLGV